VWSKHRFLFSFFPSLMSVFQVVTLTLEMPELAPLRSLPTAAVAFLIRFLCLPMWVMCHVQHRGLHSFRGEMENNHLIMTTKLYITWQDLNGSCIQKFLMLFCCTRPAVDDKPLLYIYTYAVNLPNLPPRTSTSHSPMACIPLVKALVSAKYLQWPLFQHEAEGTSPKILRPSGEYKKINLIQGAEHRCGYLLPRL
jgi:hypothetical protein